MRIKSFNSISLHLGVFLLFLSIDFSLGRCIFEKRAKCIRVRSSLGKQRLRSRGKIHSNSGERCVKGGCSCLCFQFTMWQFRDGTKYEHEKSIFCMALFRDAIGDDDSSGNSSDSRQRVQQYLLAYRSYRNILSAHFIKIVQATKTNRN